jgi:hypothetical protein
VPAGVIRTRSGDPYKPSALRTYRQALEGKLLPTLGRRHLSAISRNDLQDLVVLPLRAIFRRAVDRGIVAITPHASSTCPPCAANANEPHQQPRPARFRERGCFCVGGVGQGVCGLRGVRGGRARRAAVAATFRYPQVIADGPRSAA